MALGRDEKPVCTKYGSGDQFVQYSCVFLCLADIVIRIMHMLAGVQCVVGMTVSVAKVLVALGIYVRAEWRCTARQGGAFTSTQLFHTIAMEVRTSQRGPMYRAATAMRSTTFQHFRPAQPQHRWPLPLDLMRRTFASVRHTTRQRFTIMTDIEVENKFKPSCPEIKVRGTIATIPLHESNNITITMTTYSQ